MAKGSKRTAIREDRSSGTISLPAPAPHLLCWNQNDLASDTLPALAVPDAGVNETLPLGDAFSFLRFSDAKDANRDGRIVDFGADILVSCFRRLIPGIFDAGEKLSFTRKAAVDIGGDES